MASYRPETQGLARPEKSRERRTYEGTLGFSRQCQRSQMLPWDPFLPFLCSSPTFGGVGFLSPTPASHLWWLVFSYWSHFSASNKEQRSWEDCGWPPLHPQRPLTCDYDMGSITSKSFACGCGHSQAEGPVQRAPAESG